MNGYIALAVASSGIAALLLPGGRTAHSCFKIPLDIHEDSICAVKHGSDLASLLQVTRLIVWDEAPMVHRHAFEAVDRMLKDIMKAVDPSLEHKPSANDPDAIEQEQFAKWLLEVGEGRISTINGLESGVIRLPNDIVLPSQEINDLISFIYPNLSTYSNSKYLVERAILTPKNVDVYAINTIIMNQFPGEAIEYFSADTIEEQTNSEHQYPMEFLNSLTIGGLPPHKLSLKIGSPIILLRNINPSDGLCNGTRLVCRSFQRNVIEAEIITGKYVLLFHVLP